MYSESLESSRERLTQPQLCILHVQVLFEFFYHDDNDYDFFVFFMQDEKELCLATAQFEDFVLQFMDRWVISLILKELLESICMMVFYNK